MRSIQLTEYKSVTLLINLQARHYKCAKHCAFDQDHKTATKLVFNKIRFFQLKRV